MKIELTDEQIARVFELCAEIVSVRDSIPRAPQGYDMSVQVAGIVRENLERHTSHLEELHQLLRIAEPPTATPVDLS